MYQASIHNAVTTGNALLQSLPSTYYERLRPNMDYSVLESGRVLYDAGENIRHIYFPTSGIVSLLTITEDGCCSELAMTGRDGLVGFPVLLGDTQCPLQTLVRADGAAYRIPVDLFLRELDSNEVLRDLSYRYLYALIHQMSENAACNQHHRVEEHLARWVLNNVDMLGSPELQITQEGIATMLGVRREAISEAIGKLNRSGLIEHGRGWLRLTDKAGLEERACGCYRSNHNGLSATKGSGATPITNGPAPYSYTGRHSDAAMPGSSRKPITREVSHGIADKDLHELVEESAAPAPARHFMDVYEFSPIAQITIDQNLDIQELNMAAAILLDVRKAQLQGRGFGQFVETAFLNGLRLFCGEVLDGRGQNGYELYLRPTGRRGPIRVRIEAVSDEEGEECRMVLIGLTA